MAEKAKKHVHLEDAYSVTKAYQAILGHNLAYLSQWEQTARSWEDIEGVHQTRVAFRRLRSALTVFRLAVPAKFTSQWADTIRDLGSGFGKARDLDVFIEETLGGIQGKLVLGGADSLAALAQQRREAAYGEVRAMLDGEDYQRFKEEFGQWVESRAWEREALEDKQRRILEDNILPFARRVLDRQERHVLETGTRVDKYRAPEMHRLRIECKKLRYAAEFFFPLFSAMDEFIGHMKGLQDLLGVMNDVSVTHGLLEQILEGTQDPEVLKYAGAILGWRSCHFQELLYGFDRYWVEFVEAKHPWWKKTLGEIEQASALDSTGQA